LSAGSDIRTLRLSTVEDATVIFRSEAPRQVNLGEAFAAGVLPTWTEAVALTRGIAWQLYRAGSTAPVPELHDIALFSTGVLHIEGGSVHSDGQVAGVGTLMGEMLEHVSAPPQVTDVQRQAMASPPVYATLMEFHNALDFFARPDSKAVLVDYHARAIAALDQTDKNQALEELKEKTKSAPPPEKKKKKPERKKIPVWMVAAAAVVVLSLVGAAAYYCMGPPSPSSPVRQSASAALTAISDAGQKVQDATTSVVSKLIGGASDTPTNESPANASAPSPAPAPPVVARRRPAPSTSSGNTASSASATPAVAAPANPQAPAPAPVTAAPEAPAPSPVDVGVYTAQSPEVEAPVLVYPQLPTKQFADGSTTEPGALDVLVLEDGTVAEARLIPESNRMQDRMMVSAAKAWRFRPARKDGRPVRYRVRIPITW
jgi:cytoskeletal protein RodZ